MPTKLTEILDPIPSDSYQVGGESWNQLMKLLKGINVESEEEIVINTPFKFNSGKLIFNDQTPNPTHTYTILVENIATGDPRTITIRDTENTNEYFVFEGQTQILEKKTLHTDTKFSAVPDFQGFGADNLGPIKIHDLADNNTVFIEPSNTTTDTYFDILPNYNTATFGGLSTATDVKIRLGFGSEVDTYEFWSQADGSNSKLLSISETLFDIPQTTIDFHDSTINNILLGKSQIPSTVVHTDQANWFGNFLQTFPRGYLRINDGDTHYVALYLSNQTGNFTVSIPPLLGSDTFATLGVANVFTKVQTINAGDWGYPLVLQRPNKVFAVAMDFMLHNSLDQMVRYGIFNVGVEDNTAGAQSGNFKVQLMRQNAIATVLGIDSLGDTTIGMNQRLKFSESGLTALRTFTYPDTSGKIIVDTHTNHFLNKQKFQWNGSMDVLINYRKVKSAGSTTGLFFNLDNSSDVETNYGYIAGGIGSSATDMNVGAENGQIFAAVKVGGVNTLKLQITKDTLYTYDMIPDFTVPSTSFYAMKFYRPVNSSGTLAQEFYLQNSASVKTKFGSIGVRSIGATAGAEVGAIWFHTTTNGVDSYAARISENNFYLGALNNLVLSTSGLSANTTFTFPNLSGEVATINGVQTLVSKTLTSPIINNGALNGTFTTSGRLDITRTAGAGEAEQILRLQISDANSSYIQFDSATTGVNKFYPRMTAYNVDSVIGAVGMYQYYNIVAGADTEDNFNAVAIFDSRRSDSSPIQFKRLFQFRNAGNNVFEIYTDKFNFSNRPLENAIFNIDQSILKHGITNLEGDVLFFNNTIGKYDRKPQGSNNQFLGVVGGVLGYYTPTVGGVLALAGLTDDVNISNLQDNDVIRYDSATSKWINETLDTTAGLVTNIGGGIEIFKQLAATNELRTLTEGMGIDLTQNTDTITVGLANTITLPSSNSVGITWVKPASAGGAEKFMTFQVDDDTTGSAITIENLTGSDNRYVPGIIFSQYATELAPAGYFIGRIDPTDDVANEIAVFAINSRHNSAVVVNRPLLGIENYTAKEYLFYATYADFKGNELRNTVIHSTVTGIADVNIAAGAGISKSKLDVAGGLATTEVAGFVELATDGETAGNKVVQGSDSRLSDPRVPTTHAASHRGDGTDAIAAATNSIRGTILIANDNESAAGKAVQGNDSRMSNARTPTTHQTTHALDGSDPLVLKGLRVARTLVNTTPVTLNEQTQQTIHVDASAGNRTVNLPAASGKAGQIFFVQKIDSSANTVTIDANSTETINGATTYVLTAQWQIVTLLCDGTNWTTGSYSTERRGKTTASGNGSATLFNLPHGLGSIPHDVIVTCRTHTISSYTADATNIAVTLSSAPVSGTDNVIFDWSVVP